MQVTFSIGEKGKACSWKFKPDLLTLEVEQTRDKESDLSEFKVFCPPGRCASFRDTQRAVGFAWDPMPKWVLPTSAPWEKHLWQQGPVLAAHLHVLLPCHTGEPHGCSNLQSCCPAVLDPHPPTPPCRLPRASPCEGTARRRAAGTKCPGGEGPVTSSWS